MASTTDQYGRKTEIPDTDPYTLEYSIDQIRKFTHVWGKYNLNGHEFKDMMKYCKHVVSIRLEIMHDTGFTDMFYSIDLGIKEVAMQFVMIHDWYELISETDKVTLELGGWK